MNLCQLKQRRDSQPKKKSHNTSEQVWKVDAILPDDWLSLEKKALILDQLLIEFRIEMCGRTMHPIMSNMLDYRKHLTCKKR